MGRKFGLEGNAIAVRAVGSRHRYTRMERAASMVIAGAAQLLCSWTVGSHHTFSPEGQSSSKFGSISSVQALNTPVS